MEKWQRFSKKYALIALTIFLSILPVSFVMLDRWFAVPIDSPELFEVLHSIPLLRDMNYPPYFILVLICLAVLGLFVLWNNEVNDGFLKDSLKANQEIKPAEIKSIWNRMGVFLVVLAVFLVLLGFIESHDKQVNGWFFILSVILWLSGWILIEPPINVNDIVSLFLRHGSTCLSFLFFHFGLVFLLASYYSNKRILPFAILIFCCVSVNLTRFWRRIPLILWVMTLALLLFTIGIDHWAFSVVGDEGEFFYFARIFAEEKNIYEIGSRLFDGRGVYGTHPIFSSVLQAIFMKVFGSTYFGIRFSNCYLGSLAIGFFYLFYKRFVETHIALLAAFFLATSHYIIAFVKIGYNNLQALLVMSIVLACSAWAIAAKKHSVYAILGLCLGLCFYVYPAALYAVAIGLLLLFFLERPYAKVYGRWAATLISLALIVSPLLLQSGYWQAKVQGTLFANSGFFENPPFYLIQHLISNFLYATFSYLYIPEESHFVVVSYLDPLTSILCSIGVVFSLKLLSKERFIRFFIFAYMLLIFLVGASHDRRYPSATRMFLLLPWFSMFAAIGIEWIKRAIKKLEVSRSTIKLGLIMILGGVLLLNVIQAYPVSIRRSVGMESLEMLFYRLVQRSLLKQRDSGTSMTYIFITPEDWVIDGFLTSQTVSDSPYAHIRLERVVVDRLFLPIEAKNNIRQENTFAIIYPGMAEQITDFLSKEIEAIGKKPCDIRAIDGNTRFILWYSPRAEWICDLAQW